jgi:rRNA-processing protein FCF1
LICCSPWIGVNCGLGSFFLKIFGTLFIFILSQTRNLIGRKNVMIKIKYCKEAKKNLRFYDQFNIEPPYKIIVDLNSIVTGIKKKLNVIEQLEELLRTKKFVLCTTDSILKILTKSYGDDYQDVKDQLDNFEVIVTKKLGKCPLELNDPSAYDKHPPAARSILKALGSVNDQNYFVITDDAFLRKYIVSTLANVPMLRINNNLLHLDHPSQFAISVLEKLRTVNIRLHAKGEIKKRELESVDVPPLKKTKPQSSSK